MSQRRAGPAPARQAALKGGLSKATEAVTINKMCGSGLQAVAMARQALLAGEADVIVAGGMENMTAAPFLMAKHRTGQKYGHDKLFDHMALDGLEDTYDGKAMGVYADQTAREYQFSRGWDLCAGNARRAEATSAGRQARDRSVETKAGVIDATSCPAR